MKTKIVQIALIPDTEDFNSRLVALDSEGELWVTYRNTDFELGAQWARIPSPPFSGSE